MKTEKISAGWGKRGVSRPSKLVTQIYWLPLLVGSCVFAATVWVWQVASTQERTDIKSKVSLAAETVKNEVQARLDTRILGLRQMAKRWQEQGRPIRREWKAAAQAYLDFYPNCQEMHWVDTSFEPRWTLSRSEISAIDRASHEEILAPYKDKWHDLIVVPSPKDSKQLWVYVPMFSQGKIYGFLFAAYRTEGLFKTILNKDIAPQFEMSVFNGNTEIFNRQKDASQNSEIWGQEISFPLDGINLRVLIWPNSQMLAQEESLLSEWVLATGFLISVCLTLAVYSAQRERRRTRELEVTNLALYQQISDRERAEAALRQHTQVMDLANDAIIILDLDDAIVYWNKGAQNLYGWKKEEVAGKYVHRVLQTIFSQPIEEIKGTCWQKGYWQGEIIHTKRDGQQISVSSSWTLQRDKDGNPSGILEINKDVSERKQILSALRQSEERFRCAVYYAPFPLIVHADDGEIITLNQTWAELSGYSHDDIPTISDWVQKAYGERKKVVKENIDRLYNLNGRVEEGEQVILTSNGSERIWEFSSVPIGQLPDGRRLVMSMAVDITDRKQVQSALQQSEAQLRQKATELETTLQELQNTQAQLIQSEKMSSLGQLVAGVAHEINNPVNFIYGNIAHAKDYAQDLLRLVQLYQQQYPNPPKIIQEEIEASDLDFLMVDLPKLLASMKVGAERIREIVQSLRNFSRLDEAERKAVDIHEGIDSTLMILQNRLKGKPEHQAIQVIKEYGKLPIVECYAGQINQVFMNLLSNAIDALNDSNGYSVVGNKFESSELPSIRIRTEALDNDWVAIRIADNGHGMTEQVRQRLFDPFFTTKPIGKGTGLGLSISYQIVVQKHGGKLECYSQPDRGAEFVIEIPIRPKKREEGQGGRGAGEMGGFNNDQ